MMDAEVICMEKLHCIEIIFLGIKHRFCAHNGGKHCTVKSGYNAKIKTYRIILHTETFYIDWLVLQKFVVFHWSNFKVQGWGKSKQLAEIIGLYRGRKAGEIYATISNLSTSAVTKNNYRVMSVERPM